MNPKHYYMYRSSPYVGPQFIVFETNWYILAVIYSLMHGGGYDLQNNKTMKYVRNWM